MELFLLAVCLFLAGTASMLLPPRWQAGAHWLANLAAAAGSAVTAAAAARHLLCAGGAETAVMLRWGAYSLACDNWSAVFLLLTGIAGITASVYALGYARAYEGRRLRLLGGMWNLFILSMVLVLLAGDAFSFLVYWEIMAVASFMLVNHESEERGTWTAAYQYLVMTSVGTAFIMIAFLLTGTCSRSFLFADMARNTLSGGLTHAVFLTAFLGFALKAGLVPLHVWLPKAHPAAPSHVSALMSGVMLKIALYGFGRVIFLFVPEWHYWWALLVMVAGCLSAFLGVLYAQMETDIKRILAYSSVENMGVIFAACGCGMLLKVTSGGSWYLIGFLAALVHAFNHSVMKVLMFMSAGSIMHGTGSKNLELFGGLAKRMPRTAVCTFIGALALAALPLTNGFTGEWLALQAFITLGQSGGQEVRLWTALAFVLLGFTGALALGCFVRYFGVAFLGRARSERAEKAHESDGFMTGAMAANSLIVLATGFFPAPLIGILAKGLDIDAGAVLGNYLGLMWGGSGKAAEFTPLGLLAVLALLSLALLCFVGSKKQYVRRDVTWNCGTWPTARQQYSATGFSKPLRRAFDYLLKPRRQRIYERKDHAYFGRQLSYRLELPDMVTEKLYRPLEKYFIIGSAFLRRLQQGSVRLYVSYVMAAMCAVLIWGALYK